MGREVGTELPNLVLLLINMPVVEEGMELLRLDLLLG